MIIVFVPFKFIINNQPRCFSFMIILFKVSNFSFCFGLKCILKTLSIKLYNLIKNIPNFYVLDRFRILKTYLNFFLNIIAHWIDQYCKNVQ